MFRFGGYSDADPIDRWFPNDRMNVPTFPSPLFSRFTPNRYERQVLREEAKAGPARAAVRVVARGTLDLGPHVHAWAAALLQGP